MSTKLLLPHQYKKIGWWLFIPGSILGLYVLFTSFEWDMLGGKVFTLYAGSGLKILNEKDTGTFFTWTSGNYTNTLVGMWCLISLMLIAFSKEEREDEFIGQYRLEALLWATYINYAVLIFSFIFFFDFEFLYVMIFNMFTILIFFIPRLNFKLYRERKGLAS
jgi:L-asparagine transporter-like permease